MYEILLLSVLQWRHFHPMSRYLYPASIWFTKKLSLFPWPGIFLQPWASQSKVVVWGLRHVLPTTMNFGTDLPSWLQHGATHSPCISCFHFHLSLSLNLNANPCLQFLFLFTLYVLSSIAAHSIHSIFYFLHLPPPNLSTAIFSHIMLQLAKPRK